MEQFRNATVVLIFSIAAVFVLYIGKGLIVPFIWAMLVWYLIRGMSKSLDRVGFIRKRVPVWLKTTLSMIVFAGIYFMISNLIVENIERLIAKIPTYRENLKLLDDFVNSELFTELESQDTEELIGKYLSPVLEQISSSLSSFVSALFMVVLYALFIFAEASNFGDKMKNMFPNKSKREQYLSVLSEIDESFSHYLWVKTLISLMTAVVSFLILTIIGVDGALFWAFVIFILNYIPSIGSLIATVFPTLMAVIQFGDILHPALVGGLVGVTQIVIGNVIEPRVMGKSLNLSSLVVIFALSFWTVIWGMTGAILSVPIMVILMILFRQFDLTLPLAKALSEKGSIQSK